MSVERSRGPSQASAIPVGTLVRSVPVRLVEVSSGGCLLKSDRRLTAGTSGLLAVPLAGLVHADDVRVARCQQVAGAGAAFNVGAELLRTRRFGRRSLRAAVARIVGDGRGVGHAHPDAGEPLPVGVRTDGAGGRCECRAPPAHSDNGP
ncbi:MAG TPA: hypothetical protein PLE61_00035 [Vicinamibacterales bacterium]|nr:hypothetical protein [Vicinamibacterales bacterium]